MMELEKLAPLLTVVDLAAATVFAITGALVASRKQMQVACQPVEASSARDIRLSREWRFRAGNASPRRMKLEETRTNKAS
jgi:hypothetical protein